VIGSIRSTSNSFTTRLALVFASWAAENIIRIETAHDAFVASSRRIFLLLDFENISQQLLKVPKVPKSTFRHVWGIQGNTAMVAMKRLCLTPRSGAKFPLYLYKEHAKGKRYRNNLNVTRTESQSVELIVQPIAVVAGHSTPLHLARSLGLGKSISVGFGFRRRGYREAGLL
jgi:hypothetical protein